MANDKSIFNDFNDTIKVKDESGNSVMVESKGKGTVMVETKKGTRLINDVLLVPNLKENLLSIGQMIEKGYALHFEGDTCTIYDNYNRRQVIAKVKMDKGTRSFPISFKYITKIAMKAEVVGNVMLNQKKERVKKNIFVQPKEKVKKEVGDSGTLPPPLQRQKFLLESTPRRRERSSRDTYEICTMIMIDTECYRVASKYQNQYIMIHHDKKSSSTIRRKNQVHHNGKMLRTNITSWENQKQLGNSNSKIARDKTKLPTYSQRHFQESSSRNYTLCSELPKFASRRSVEVAANSRYL